MSLANGRCDRCGASVRSLRMSMFNTEMCCQPCLGKEKRHPRYKEAQEAEREQMLQGNYNFEGIGKPEDL